MFRSQLVEPFIASYFGAAGGGLELADGTGRLVDSTAGAVGRFVAVNSEAEAVGGVGVGVEAGAAAGGAAGASAGGWSGFSMFRSNSVVVRR